MTQAESILAYLRKGHALTPVDALVSFGCFRLGARVHGIRNGEEANLAANESIHAEAVKLENGKRVASYSLRVEGEPVRKETP